MLVASQLRAARGLLGWSQTKLAESAGLSLPTIKRMEGAVGPGRSAAENVDAVRRALEAAGVAFISGGEASPAGGPGVRLKDQTEERSR